MRPRNQYLPTDFLHVGRYPALVPTRTNGYVIDDLVHCYRSETRQTLSAVLLMATPSGPIYWLPSLFPKIT